MIYKLLTYNNDYADEMNVPALEVMTEEKFNEWCETPSGKLNPSYGKQMLIYEQKVKAYKDAQTELRENNWHLLDDPKKQLKKVEYTRYEELRKHAYIGPWASPPKVKSFMHAYLGNMGDGFSSGFTDFYLHQDFIDKGLVKVFDVSEEFYNTFRNCNLGQLSLTNIFITDKENY